MDRERGCWTRRKKTKDTKGKKLSRLLGFEEPLPPIDFHSHPWMNDPESTHLLGSNFNTSGVISPNTQTPQFTLPGDAPMWGDAVQTNLNFGGGGDTHVSNSSKSTTPFGGQKSTHFERRGNASLGRQQSQNNLFNGGRLSGSQSQVPKWMQSLGVKDTQRSRSSTTWEGTPTTNGVATSVSTGGSRFTSSNFPKRFVTRGTSYGSLLIIQIRLYTCIVSLHSSTTANNCVVSMNLLTQYENCHFSIPKLLLRF